ncbi:MAG: hypothetical protein AAF086_02170 [Planctomycetota bacterium]
MVDLVRALLVPALNQHLKNLLLVLTPECQRHSQRLPEVLNL